MLSESTAERRLVSPLCITDWMRVDLGSREVPSVVAKGHACPQIFQTCLFCVCLMFSDQTPTPTRFLQNCEEVGLFKEIEEEFLQEEENNKQVNVTGKQMHIHCIIHCKL